MGKPVQISKKLQYSGTNQFWRHFFNFGNQISKKLCHIFLLPSIQRLLIHGVCLTEGSRVICFTFTLLQRSTGSNVKQSNK